MRILYQLTSPMHRTLGDAEIARRRAVMAAAVEGGTEITVEPVEDGPASIEGPGDIAAVMPHLLQRAAGWERDGFDAVVVGCFSDPGMDALQDAVAIPVVGPGAASMHLAAQFGSRFSILSNSGFNAGRVAARLRALGLADLFASIRDVECTVMDLARRDERALDRIVAAGRACTDRDGAEVLVLGCMSMAFLPGVVEALRDRLDCEVINPVFASVKTAEMAVALGLGSAARRRRHGGTGEGAAR